MEPKIDDSDPNPQSPAVGFNAIVGNPPFLNQLSSETARNRGLAALIKARTEGLTSAYTDAAAVFWIDAMTKVAAGGRVAFLLPQSVLASRDASAIRERLTQTAALEHLWVGTDHAFADALVATCAAVVRNEPTESHQVQRTYSLEFSELPTAELPAQSSGHTSTWSELAADAFGIPNFPYVSNETIGSIADATADFRDEYYGLSGFITEHSEHTTAAEYPPLITSGMIDPACNRWGSRPSKVLKETWIAPRVDRRAMASCGTLSSWIDNRLVPKILVATQSRVIELCVDEEGTLLPCMPVLTVTPREREHMWRVAAALGSPVVCAIAMSRYSGTALTTDAIKLAAKQVVELPTPNRCAFWDDAAALYHRASDAPTDDSRIDLLIESARLMNSAYELDENHRKRLMDWWTPRLLQTFGKSKDS